MNNPEIILFSNMDGLLSKLSYDQILGCIDDTSKKLGIRRHDVIRELQDYYPDIEDYIVDQCNVSHSVGANADIVFFYFSKSAESLLGRGAGEKITDSADFSELAKIKGWRKMLSNFWIAPFKLDGLTWNSVEHYYQGSKFRKSNYDFFKLFSLESGSEISKNPEIAKAAGGKSGKYKGELLRPENILMDKDFFERKRCDKDMYRAMMAKFSQNKELERVLILTKDATLTHGTRGVPTKPIYTLMKVREELR